MSENYIKEIFLGDRDERRKHGARQSEPSVIPLSYPRYKSQKEGCITVICGRNNSGKSHILRNINQALKQKPHQKTSDSLQYESEDILVSLSNPEAPKPEKILYLSDLTSAKKTYEHFNLGNNKGDTNGKGIPKYKVALLEFIKSQFEEHISPPNEQSWKKDGSYRLKYLENLETEKLYICNQNNLIVQKFQKAVQGILYLQKTTSVTSRPLEIWLCYDNNRRFNYGNWSDGQKTLFICLLQLDYLRPDILLIDEIENHFHPEYITQLCSLIKETTRQTILVTHHPHVLFSNYVNQVIYIETLVNTDKEFEKVLEMSDTFISRSPKREIRKLSTDFEKISSVYGLFDQQDHQLLQLAYLMDDLIEREFVNIFSSFTKNKLDKEGENIKQNTQGNQFRKALNPSSVSNLKVLDFGVSKGIIFEEFMKRPCAEVEWHFWNPQKERHQELENLTSEYKDVNTRVIKSEDEIQNNFYDFAVLSNWLHLLTPLEFAHTLDLIQKSLKKSSGELIILELYPLISRQRYAVPYDENTLAKILRVVGWKCESDQVKFSAEYISAYWIRAYQPNKEIVCKVAKNADEIRKLWHEDIKPRVCEQYNDMSRMSSVQSFVRFMSDFKTIMSIINESQNLWQSTNKGGQILIQQEEQSQTESSSHPTHTTHNYGDRYYINQAGNVGKNASSDNNTFKHCPELKQTLDENYQ